MPAAKFLSTPARYAAQEIGLRAAFRWTLVRRPEPGAWRYPVALVAGIATAWAAFALGVVGAMGSPAPLFAWILTAGLAAAVIRLWPQRDPVIVGLLLAGAGFGQVLAPVVIDGYAIELILSLCVTPMAEMS